MKRNFDIRQIECDRCGAKVLNDVEAHLAGWDWFTGRNLNTVHWCANCLRVARNEYDQMRDTAMRSNADVTGLAPRKDEQ